MARRTPKTDAQRVEFIPNFRPFIDKLPIPAADICDEPCTVYRINNDWRNYFLSAMHTLDQPDVWDSEDPEAIFAARQQVRELIAMSPCRCVSGATGTTRGALDELLGEVNQELFDIGGLDGIAPDRPDTTFSEDSGDDAHEETWRRQVALCWACFDYVSSVAEKGILQGININPAITLASVGLSFLFSPVVGIGFGVVTQALILLVSETMKGDETVLAVACCMYDGLLGETITEAHFNDALDTCPDVTDLDEVALKNLVASGLDEQKNYLAFLKVLGSYMGATDNLSDCPCTPPACSCDFEIGKCGWDADAGRAVYVPGVGWDNSPGGADNHTINITFQNLANWNIAWTRVVIDNQELEDDVTVRTRLLDEFGVSQLTRTRVLSPGQNASIAEQDITKDFWTLQVHVFTTAFPDDNIDVIIKRVEILVGDCVFPGQ